MRTFYIVQMISGLYLAEYRGFFDYSPEMHEAIHFDSKKEAVECAPGHEPFTVIKFYDK